MAAVKAAVMTQMGEHFPKTKGLGKTHGTYSEEVTRARDVIRSEHLAARTQGSLGKPQLMTDVQQVAFLLLSQGTLLLPLREHYRVHMHASVNRENAFPSNP